MMIISIHLVYFIRQYFKVLYKRCIPCISTTPTSFFHWRWLTRSYAKKSTSNTGGRKNYIKKCTLAGIQ